MAERVHFPDHLKALRKSRGWRQADLAEAAGFASASELSRYERGARIPTDDRSKALSDALQLAGKGRADFLETIKKYRESTAAPDRQSAGRHNAAPRSEPAPSESPMEGASGRMTAEQALAAVATRRVSQLARSEAGTHINPVIAVRTLQRAVERAGGFEHASPRLSTTAITALIDRYRRSAAFSQVSALQGEVLERGRGRGLLQRTYPVVVFPPARGQALDSVLPVENVRADLASVIQPGELAMRDPYPRLWRRLVSAPTEAIKDGEATTAAGWNLAMSELGRDPSGRLVMRARLATYGLIMDSCDALMDEAFADPAQERGWPLRDAVDAADGNPILRARRRAAGIGIAAVITVVAREPDGTFRLDALIGRRSNAVGTYPDTWHVAPAGMFNWRFGGRVPNGSPQRPHGSYDAGDLLRSVLTEYGEETHNLRKLEDNMERDYLESRPVVRKLVKNAEFHFTGVALDLANLRPEICVLIYVSDPSWHGRQKFKLNYEYRNFGRPVGGEEKSKATKKRHLWPLTVANEHGALDDPALVELDPAETVASGAAAFWLGVDKARAMFASELRARHQSGTLTPTSSGSR
jgi:transcriptional regulator with XRE-family HTH domain